MSGVIPPFPPYAFKACTGKTSLFTFNFFSLSTFVPPYFHTHHAMEEQCTHQRPPSCRDRPPPPPPRSRGAIAFQIPAPCRVSRSYSRTNTTKIKQLTAQLAAGAQFQLQTALYTPEMDEALLQHAE
jgi:hypothetical protein